MYLRDWLHSNCVVVGSILRLHPHFQSGFWFSQDVNPDTGLLLKGFEFSCFSVYLCTSGYPSEWPWLLYCLFNQQLSGDVLRSLVRPCESTRCGWGFDVRCRSNFPPLTCKPCPSPMLWSDGAQVWLYHEKDATGNNSSVSTHLFCFNL